MAKLVLLTPLLILIPVTSSTPITSRDIGRCPEKWVMFGHSCYKLIREKHRWHDAQTICKTLDSSLVNIGSKQEDRFVVRMAHIKGVTVWTGLSDVVQEGHFVWTDTQEDPKYTNWFTGQPDNRKGKEDCAAMWYDHGGRWNDVVCDNKLAAVCEKPSVDVDDDDDDDDDDDEIDEEQHSNEQKEIKRPEKTTTIQV